MALPSLLDKLGSLLGDVDAVGQSRRLDAGRGVHRVTEQLEPSTFTTQDTGRDRARVNTHS